jgi:Na+/H+ antiporter NhaA
MILDLRLFQLLNMTRLSVYNIFSPIFAYIGFITVCIHFSIVKIVIAFMVVVRGEKMAAQLIPRE